VKAKWISGIQNHRPGIVEWPDVSFQKKNGVLKNKKTDPEEPQNLASK
jgi:hypothetical protein